MTTVRVELPRLVADATGVARVVEVAGDDTRQVLEALFAAHPGVRAHLVDERGRLRENVLCALDGEATRLHPPAPVDDGSTLRFVPSVAGG